MPRRTSAALAAAVALLLVVGAAAPVAAAPVVAAPVEPTAPVAAAAGPTSIQVVGRGFGHGRGMGQFGALGYVLGHGWDYRAVLDHYYGGTTMGAIEDLLLRVRLTAADDQPVVVVRPAGGVTVEAAELPAQVWPAVQAAPNPDGVTWTVSASTDCVGSTGWAPLGVVAGPVTFTAPGAEGTADPDALLAVCRPDTTLRAYRGLLQATRGTDQEARLVNEVSVERYLRGVVPRESPASWGALGGGAGMHQLRAQAVTARSYAVSQNRYSYAGTCDTTACQVYGGAAIGLPGDWQVLEDPRTDQAIAETAGQVRVRNGVVISTEYSSSTGGWTAGGTFPSVEDLGDAIASNPNRVWSATIATSTIEAAYPQIGAFRAVTVSRRNGIGEFGGRAVQVVVQGATGAVRLSGNDFRSRFSLRSDWFRITSGFLSAPAVAVAQGPSSSYWVAGQDGSVLNVDGASYLGSLDDRRLAAAIVSMSATADGRGYWLLGADGGVFSFGSAPFYGSTGDQRLNRRIVGMAPRPQGDGYWFVGEDGGVFAFGAAGFFGSTGDVVLNRPIIGMAPTSTGQGYWLIASDGGVFAFGDAVFHGSTGGVRLNEPIVGMAVRPQGDGYWFVAADGGVFTFGAAGFHGSLGAATRTSPIVGMSVTASGEGYRLVLADGTSYGFGDAA